MRNFLQAMGALSRDMLFFQGHVASPRALANFAGSGTGGDNARRPRQDRRSDRVCKRPRQTLLDANRARASQRKRAAARSGWTLVGLR